MKLRSHDPTTTVRRALAALTLAVVTPWFGARDGEDARPSFVGRLIEADGTHYSGSFTVDVRVWQSDTNHPERPPRLETRSYEGTTDSEGRFDFRARLLVPADELGPLELRVAPRAKYRAGEPADAALPNALAARAWLGTRTLETDDERGWIVDCGTLVFEPAPVVASLRFASQHPSLSVALTGELTEDETHVVGAPRPRMAPVPANTWIDFHSWSRASAFAVEGVTSRGEWLVPLVVQRGERREVVLTRVSGVCVAVDSTLAEPPGESFYVAQVPSGGAAAERFVSPTAEFEYQSEPDVVRALRRRSFAVARVPGADLTHEFVSVPDGTHRAEHWSDAALTRGTPDAVAEFTAPHVGWIELALR